MEDVADAGADAVLEMVIVPVPGVFVRLIFVPAAKFTAVDAVLLIISDPFILTGL